MAVIQIYFLDPVVIGKLRIHVRDQAHSPVVQGDNGGRLGIVHHVQARIWIAGVEPGCSAVLGEAQPAPGILDQQIRTRVVAGFSAGVCLRLMVQLGGVFGVRCADVEVIMGNITFGPGLCGCRSWAIGCSFFVFNRAVIVSVQPVHGFVARADGDRFVWLDTVRARKVVDRCLHFGGHIGDFRKEAAGFHQHVFDIRRFDLVVNDVENLVRCQRHVGLGGKGAVHRLILGSVDQVHFAVARVVINGFDGILLDIPDRHARFFNHSECAAIQGIILFSLPRDRRGQVSRGLMRRGQGDRGIAVGRVVIVAIHPGRYYDGGIIRGIHDDHIASVRVVPKGIQIQRIRDRLRKIIPC